MEIKTPQKNQDQQEKMDEEVPTRKRKSYENQPSRPNAEIKKVRTPDECMDRNLNLSSIFSSNPSMNITFQKPDNLIPVIHVHLDKMTRSITLKEEKKEDTASALTPEEKKIVDQLDSISKAYKGVEIKKKFISIFTKQAMTLIS